MLLHAWLPLQYAHELVEADSPLFYLVYLNDDIVDYFVGGVEAKPTQSDTEIGRNQVPTLGRAQLIEYRLQLDNVLFRHLLVHIGLGILLRLTGTCQC